MSDTSDDTPLNRARAAKIALRTADKAAREVRNRWTTARTVAARDMPHKGDGVWGDREKIGDLTYAMWAAEQTLARATEEWRRLLEERLAMPKAERWNLAGVERWAEINEALTRVEVA